MGSNQLPFNWKTGVKPVQALRNLCSLPIQQGIFCIK